MANIYITGDTHGEFARIKTLCRSVRTNTEDVVIILGDAGFNYYGDMRDDLRKFDISRQSITVFCIHGNHEARPATIPSYKTKEFCGGTVWYEEQYPNILFAKDGEIYTFNGLSCLVIGGAYSVDKYYRLSRGLKWFPDEQPDEATKAYVERQIGAHRTNIDVVLSHTCPLKYIPTEVFLPGVDQSTVDNSTEEWLDKIEETLVYKKWYCGHYHTDKRIDRLRFMFSDVAEFGVGKESLRV